MDSKGLRTLYREENGTLIAIREDASRRTVSQTFQTERGPATSVMYDEKGRVALIHLGVNDQRRVDFSHLERRGLIPASQTSAVKKEIGARQALIASSARVSPMIIPDGARAEVAYAIAGNKTDTRVHVLTYNKGIGVVALGVDDKTSRVSDLTGLVETGLIRQGDKDRLLPLKPAADAVPRFVFINGESKVTQYTVTDKGAPGATWLLNYEHGRPLSAALPRDKEGRVSVAPLIAKGFVAPSARNLTQDQVGLKELADQPALITFTKQVPNLATPDKIVDITPGTLPELTVTGVDAHGRQVIYRASLRGGELQARTTYIEGDKVSKFNVSYHGRVDPSTGQGEWTQRHIYESQSKVLPDGKEQLLRSKNRWENPQGDSWVFDPRQQWLNADEDSLLKGATKAAGDNWFAKAIGAPGHGAKWGYDKAKEGWVRIGAGVGIGDPIDNEVVLAASEIRRCPDVNCSQGVLQRMTPQGRQAAVLLMQNARTDAVKTPMDADLQMDLYSGRTHVPPELGFESLGKHYSVQNAAAACNEKGGILCRSYAVIDTAGATAASTLPYLYLGPAAQWAGKAASAGLAGSRLASTVASSEKLVALATRAGDAAGKTLHYANQAQLYGGLTAGAVNSAIAYNEGRFADSLTEAEAGVANAAVLAGLHAQQKQPGRALARAETKAADPLRAPEPPPHAQPGKVKVINDLLRRSDESRNPSVHERQAAQRKAQELMARHDVTPEHLAPDARALLAPGFRPSAPPAARPAPAPERGPPPSAPARVQPPASPAASPVPVAARPNYELRPRGGGAATAAPQAPPVQAAGRPGPRPAEALPAAASARAIPSAASRPEPAASSPRAAEPIRPAESPAPVRPAQAAAVLEDGGRTDRGSHEAQRPLPPGAQATDGNSGRSRPTPPSAPRSRGFEAPQPPEPPPSTSVAPRAEALARAEPPLESARRPSLEEPARSAITPPPDPKSLRALARRGVESFHPGTAAPIKRGPRLDPAPELTALQRAVIYGRAAAAEPEAPPGGGLGRTSVAPSLDAYTRPFYAGAQEAGQLRSLARNPDFEKLGSEHPAYFADHGDTHKWDTIRNSVKTVSLAMEGGLIPRRAGERLAFMESVAGSVGALHDMWMVDLSKPGRRWHPNRAGQEVFRDAFDGVLADVLEGPIGRRVRRARAEGRLSQDAETVTREILSLNFAHSKTQVPLRVLDDASTLRSTMQKALREDTQLPAERKAGLDIEGYYRPRGGIESSYAWLLEDPELAADVIDSVRSVRVGDAFRYRGPYDFRGLTGATISVTPAGQAVYWFTDPATGRKYPTVSDNPFSIGEANTRLTRINERGELVLGTQRSRFETPAARAQAVAATVHVFWDVYQDYAGSFRGAQGREIALERAPDEGAPGGRGFTEEVADALRHKYETELPRLRSQGRLLGDEPMRIRIEPASRTSEAERLISRKAGALEDGRYARGGPFDRRAAPSAAFWAKVGAGGIDTAGLDARTRNRMLYGAKLVTLEPGEIVVVRGAPPGYVYVPLRIPQGSGLEVHVAGGYATFPLREGVPFGEISAVTGNPRNADIRVVGTRPIELVMLPASTYLQHWSRYYTHAELVRRLRADYAREESRGQP
ncbi:MAG: DUF2786 domain-containing protein [Elusimicrobia bacterium]|nr:DUF2786 domain-containing protein [Elusimicrobiota bacterium]